MKIDKSYISNKNTYDNNVAKYIIVHNTDNFKIGADAKTHAKAQYNGNLSASVHYYTDDSDTVYQTAPHGKGCWHVGVNYGGKLFGTVNNKNTIAVEMCVQQGYNFQLAFAQTVGLVKQLMKETGIKADNVLQHYDVCAKNCPSQIRGKEMWEEFKRQISASNESTSGTRIMGPAAATVGQMETYIKGKNSRIDKSVLDMLSLYLEEGKAEGVRGDVAFAQSCLETGNFTFSGSAVKLSQNNFCGMGVASNGMKGNSFDTPRMGIRAQIQHLKAYGSTAAIVNTVVDPRFKYVVRGSAEYVEWLGIQENPNGKGWAAGKGYGGKILNILKAILGVTDNDTATTGQKIKSLSGYVKVIYRGKDGLNVRTAPSFGDNVKQIVHEGTFTVVGISADGQWYKLKSGLYITTGEKYVQFSKSLVISEYKVKVSVSDLYIRKGPGTNYGKQSGFTGKGTFTIVEEADGQGASKWGLLKYYQKNRDGWISLDYAVRI